MRNGFSALQQCGGKYFVDGVHRENLELFPRGLGDIGDVLEIEPRHEDGLDSRLDGTERFFLEPADGQDGASQIDLAGHGDFFVDAAIGEE